MSIGGADETPAVKEKGAQLRFPLSLQVPTKAIGRGTNKLVSKK